MTLQFIFFTIVVTKRKKTLEQYRHDEQIMNYYNEAKSKHNQMY